MTVKNRGLFFADFATYHLEGLLISHAKFSEKVSNEYWIDKKFLKTAKISLSRWLPIEGIFLSQDKFSDLDSVYK